jgi:hypothetical protein
LSCYNHNGVNTPWRTQDTLTYRSGMKANHKKQALTFGNLIETVYGVRGNRGARGIIRLAMDAHVIVFRKQHRAFDFGRRKVSA